MSSVLTKNVRLGLPNPVQQKSDKAVEVESVRPRNKIDPATRKPTDTVEDYMLNFFGVSGGIQSVKLPLDTAKTIEKIAEALARDAIVKVNFGTSSTLVAKFYAMLANGQLIQGITATATTIDAILND